MTTTSQPRPAALVISLDVDLDETEREGSAEAIRRTLELLAERELHATWALVGLERGGPIAAELIATILAHPNQEIGAQTWACYHGDRVGALDLELGAAVATAEHHGVQLRSLVFPAAQCKRETLPILARHGVTAYRNERPGWAFAPSRSRLLDAAKRRLRVADNFSLLIPDAAIPLQRVLAQPREQPINIPASRFVRAYDPRLRQLESLRVHRMQSEMITAAESGWLYHLWLRPQEFAPHLYENLVALDNLLRNARALAGRLEFRSLTMAELAGEPS